MDLRLNILLVASTLDDDGGIPVCVAQLGTALAESGHPVEIVGQYAHGIAGVIAAAGRAANIHLHALHHPWSLAGQIAAARRVATLIAERARACRAGGRRLVVHNHGVWVPTVLAAAHEALVHSAHLVISPHGMLRAPAMSKSRLKKRFVLQTLLRRQLAAADAIQATSPTEAEDLRQLLPGCEPLLVPLGITPPAPPKTPQHRPPTPRTAGYLGRILPIKNLDALLRAWATVRPAGWRLRIAGPGEPAILRELRVLADALGIAGCVSLEPAVPHESLGDFFASLDLFILPSRSEAFSLTVGEALAAGVPAITTTAAPWTGVVPHECGWCVEPNQHALESAIREATGQSTERLESMGSRGASWVRRDYSWRTIAERHIHELYNH
jgi:glycosyltransferase involved in cell wall biosynthesis